ncbi:MAG TPA: hypothetical protein VMR33_16260 [Candidatus Baltobacteraceae bacterium]|jgi:hypothetical protein|nr:hypothetical protein [Candidatus Baltobacteraceae bacterium]
MRNIVKTGLVLATLLVSGITTQAQSSVTMIVTLQNNSSLAIDNLELYISGLGCSAGFFGLNQACGTIEPGSYCGVTMNTDTGATGKTITFCQANYVDGSSVPTQYWVGNGLLGVPSITIPGAGTYNYIVYFFGGDGGGGPPSASTQTNSGCITLNNTTTQVQYYQFGYQNAALDGGTLQGLSGCSTNISASISGSPQEQGNDANNPNNFMAVYPGQSVTVCHTDVSPVGSPSQFMAYMAASGSYPCGLTVGQPACVSLCGSDGVPVTSPAFGGQGTLAGTTTETSGSGPPSVPNPNPGTTTNGMFTGTNGIIWQDSQTNGGLMLDATGKEGFAALHNDNVVDAVAAAANAAGIESAIANAATGIEGAIRSNSVVVSNQVSITNFPTNFPDAAAIGLLGTIATNTARTNSFDTNLEASASAITSNTAAPLAYTNLGIAAYSTNPADIVGYASNTLAGPVNASMLNYAQSASTAGAAVTVGGSPGELLTISFDLPGVGSYAIDCNPMDNSDIADFASWFRNVMEWLVGLGFVGMVLRDGTEATRTAILTPQGQFPKLTVLGNSIGWPLAAVYIVAIVAAIAAVPFAVVTWFSVGSTGAMWWQEIAVNPFSGAGVGRAVGLSLWLADQFLPMSYIVSSALYYIAFRFTLNGVVTVAATIVRALMA